MQAWLPASITPWMQRSFSTLTGNAAHLQVNYAAPADADLAACMHSTLEIIQQSFGMLTGSAAHLQVNYAAPADAGLAASHHNTLEVIQQSFSMLTGSAAHLQVNYTAPADADLAACMHSTLAALLEQPAAASCWKALVPFVLGELQDPALPAFVQANMVECLGKMSQVGNLLGYTRSTMCNLHGRSFCGSYRGRRWQHISEDMHLDWLSTHIKSAPAGRGVCRTLPCHQQSEPIKQGPSGEWYS